MIERVRDRFGLYPNHLAGDSAYGAAEMLFAHSKCILKLGRLRLQGSFGANDELLLAATAQKLRKLAKPMTSRHTRWLSPRNIRLNQHNLPNADQEKIVLSLVGFPSQLMRIG